MDGATLDITPPPHHSPRPRKTAISHHRHAKIPMNTHPILWFLGNMSINLREQKQVPYSINEKGETMSYNWITAREKAIQKTNKGKSARYTALHPSPKKLLQKECPICSATFTTRNAQRIYCSSKCSGRATRQRQRKGGTRIKNVFDRIATIRWRIFNRDDFRCQYCGKTAIEDHVKLHLDHIKPRADGGTDDIDNLVTACEKCNIGKMDIPLRHEAEFKARINAKNETHYPR